METTCFIPDLQKKKKKKKKKGSDMANPSIIKHILMFNFEVSSKLLSGYQTWKWL